MPELPEVEVVRLGLAPVVTGAFVRAVEVFDERALTRHDGSALDFVSRLEGARLEAPSRRGKFLWVPIEGRDEALVGHLGMSGQLLVRAPDASDERHLRVRLRLEGAGGDYSVAFVDQRTFGSLAVDRLEPVLVPGSVSVPAPGAGRVGAGRVGTGTGTGTGLTGALGRVERIPSQVGHIARDPLDPAFDDDAFVRRLRSKRTGLKAALLDQTLISGIGNIYADESLWMARLHYAQQADTVSVRKARELLAHVRAVLEKALAEGGTSFDAQYVNVNGQAGYFAHSLNAYGRHGEPCARCGGALVREQFQNRGSHFCPRCQRLRRAALR